MTTLAGVNVAARIAELSTSTAPSSSRSSTPNSTALSARSSSSGSLPATEPPTSASSCLPRWTFRTSARRVSSARTATSVHASLVARSVRGARVAASGNVSVSGGRNGRRSRRSSTRSLPVPTSPRRNRRPDPSVRAVTSPARRRRFRPGTVRAVRRPPCSAPTTGSRPPSSHGGSRLAPASSRSARPIPRRRLQEDAGAGAGWQVVGGRAVRLVAQLIASLEASWGTATPSLQLSPQYVQACSAVQLVPLSWHSFGSTYAMGGTAGPGS